MKLKFKWKVAVTFLPLASARLIGGELDRILSQSFQSDEELVTAVAEEIIAASEQGELGNILNDVTNAPGEVGEKHRMLEPKESIFLGDQSLGVTENEQSNRDRFIIGEQPLDEMEGIDLSNTLTLAKSLQHTEHDFGEEKLNAFHSASEESDEGVTWSQSFRLMMFWKEGYFWQEKRQRQFYCMKCESSNCRNGSDIKMTDKCDDDKRLQFQFSPDTRQFRMAYYRDLCITRKGPDDGEKLEVQTCSSDSKQKWDPFNHQTDRKRFLLIPKVDHSMCVSPQHHPRSGELAKCWTCGPPNAGYDTVYWIDCRGDGHNSCDNHSF